MELPGVGKPPGSSGASAVPEIRGSRHLVPVRDKARQERDGEDSNEIGNGKHGGGGGSRQRGGELLCYGGRGFMWFCKITHKTT
jgi:hypothetical protein